MPSPAAENAARGAGTPTSAKFTAAGHASSKSWPRALIAHSTRLRVRAGAGSGAMLEDAGFIAGAYPGLRHATRRPGGELPFGAHRFPSSAAPSALAPS